MSLNTIEVGHDYPFNNMPTGCRKATGVYIIFNSETDKCYVGASMSVRDRWKSHANGLKHGKHASKSLQKDFNANKNLLVFRFVEKCEVENLADRETYWLHELEANKPEWGYCGPKFRISRNDHW